MSVKKFDQNDAILWGELLDALASGATYKQFLFERGICLVSFSAFLRANPDKYQEIKAARVIGADVLAQEAINISDTEQDAALAALRVKTRLHVASRYAPEYLGDKMTLQVNTVSLNNALSDARNRLKQSTIDVDVSPSIPEYPTKTLSLAESSSSENKIEFKNHSAQDDAARNAEDSQGKDAPEITELVEKSKEYS